ncbi:hypothetical protein KAT92_06575, partial [Candidatus Babeliales bacterium]|nr:hypothetical protein [Candidatus Babeliales bacterium]
QSYDLDLERMSMARDKVQTAKTDRGNKLKLNELIADRIGAFGGQGGEAGPEPPRPVDYGQVREDVLASGIPGSMQAAQDISGFMPKTGTPSSLKQVDLGDRVEFRNPNTGELVKTMEKGTSPTSERYSSRWKYKDETALRKELQERPIVQDFEQLQPQYERVTAAMDRLYDQPDKDRNWLAVDQTLITILNKMLDPSSVVRESEYERTPKNLSLLNRFKGKIESWTTGGAGLTNQDRDEIAYMSEQFYEIAKGKYKNETDYYSDIARDNNFNPNNIVRPGRAEGREYKSRFEAAPEPSNISYTAEQEDAAFNALGADATDQDLDAWLVENYSTGGD